MIVVLLLLLVKISILKYWLSILSCDLCSLKVVIWIGQAWRVLLGQ